MATLRELKGRIGSVASSEKITGAMKMISSAKMHKAEQSLRRLLPFRTQIESIIGNLLTADADFSSPLLEARQIKNVSVVVFGSDDGLCGAYNVNIFKQLLQHLDSLRKKYGQDVTFSIYPVGAKMLKAVSKIAINGIDVVTAEGVDSKTTGDGVRVFVDELQARFLSGDTDKVDILYMSFKSISRQRPVAEQLLPVVAETFAANDVTPSLRPYIFEPDATTIFRSVLPMFIMADRKSVV